MSRIFLISLLFAMTAFRQAPPSGPDIVKKMHDRYAGKCRHLPRRFLLIARSYATRQISPLIAARVPADRPIFRDFALFL
jgi:hypothetical protein